MKVGLIVEVQSWYAERLDHVRPAGELPEVIPPDRNAFDAGEDERSRFGLDVHRQVLLEADVVISICPPHAATEVARDVASIRPGDFLDVDANTIAPGTVREIAGMFRPNVVVDATLTGSPGTDNLTIWVSGARNSEVCNLFSGSRVTSRTVSDTIGQASAFKICAGLRSKVIPAV